MFLWNIEDGVRILIRVHGTANVEQFYLNTYTNSIIKDLEAENHMHKLNQFDYFYVTVKNTNKTQASIINNIVANDNSNFKIGCAYGGIVWSIRDN